MKCINLMILNLVITVTAFGQVNTTKPDFILLDGKLLQNIAQQYHNGDKITVKQIGVLLNQADSIIRKTAYSVTFDKTKLAPSGNKHDYVSQAPYWWPDSSKSGGKPYVRKDGRRNPEIYLLHDDSQLTNMCAAVNKLALAYAISGNENYAVKAATLLQVWFIDPATLMNPNLNYAQYIPGINDGRGIGIIETRSLTKIPDAIEILKSSQYFTPALIAGIKKWYAQYIEWMLNSENGKAEKSQINNHGTNYDMQLTDFALFTDNKVLAVKVIDEFTMPRIDQQFTTDGLQPLELVRTRSWDYSTMNLAAWAKLAIMAERLNIDLWHRQTLDGKGIKVAIEWLLPFAEKQKKWTYPEIGAFDYGNFQQIIHAAKDQYPDVSFSGFSKLFPVENQLSLLE